MRPCLNGLPLIADAFAALANRRAAPSTRGDLARWSKLVERRGACHHPDGTVRFLRSALTVFAEEVALHETGRCSAGTDAPFLPDFRVMNLYLDAYARLTGQALPEG